MLSIIYKALAIFHKLVLSVSRIFRMAQALGCFDKKKVKHA